MAGTDLFLIKNLVDLSYGILFAFFGLCRLLLWLGAELSLVDGHRYRDTGQAESLLTSTAGSLPGASIAGRSMSGPLGAGRGQDGSSLQSCKAAQLCNAHVNAFSSVAALSIFASDDRCIGYNVGWVSCS